MTKNAEKQYIYIVQASLEPSRCKIGKTNNLERRLKEYNSMTGKSKNNVYQYLFACEVKDSAQVENDIAKAFPHFREEVSREIYFLNKMVFNGYVDFIKSHKSYKDEIIIKTDVPKEITKIVKRETPSLKERALTRKAIMQQAQKAKDDEFYTRYEDIEKELSMYDKETWKDKTVFCNCDDAVGDDRTDNDTSAFSSYFLNNFHQLGLKKLICTHYGGGLNLFNQGVKGYVFTKEGFSEIKDYVNGYTGSFDDPLSIKILKEDADIVCTNPPFSKMPEYWELVIGSGKKFIIISNISNAVTGVYIPYFKNGKIWAGYNRIDHFLNPKKQLVDASGHWYTNIPIKERPKWELLKIVPLKEIPEKYKKIDDTKTLLVDNCYIPSDYKKPFAVSARPILNGILEKGYELIQDREYYPYIKEEKKFARVLIQKN